MKFGHLTPVQKTRVISKLIHLQILVICYFFLDHRSLFERLEENKRAKDAEYAQQHDIKNVVRGIDDDEAAFLDKVDEIKSVAELQRIREERKELEEYKKMQEKLMEENEQKRLKDDVVTAKSNQAKLEQPKKTQSKLLSGVLGIGVKSNVNF